MKLVATLAVVAVFLGFSLGQGVAASRRSQPQAPAAAPHPTFAGTWTPSDPALNDKYFSKGLNRIPGLGRLTIDQRPDRLTLTISMPDDLLSSMLANPFYPTIVMRLSDARRSGGAGANGPQPISGPTWSRDQLTIPDPWPVRVEPSTLTFSLDGDRLKVDTRWVGKDTPVPPVMERWFNRSLEPKR